MSPGNSSRALAFLLTGIPGMARFHRWVFLPCCLMYLITMLGNSTILLIVRVNRRLHQPMYYFLSMLAITDLGLTLSTLPTVLRVFWFGSGEISFPVCLTQMFCIHAFSFMESSVLLAMAFDRYVAICCPLRYSSILTSARIAKIGLGMVCRSLTLLPLICLLTQLQFCSSRVLSHSFCLHQDVMNLACANTTPSVVYGLTAILLVMGLDAILICLSYILILKAVLRLASWKERLKVFSTCVAHICVVLAFYVPLIGLSVVHRFGKDLAPLVHIIMGNIYILVPAVLNPIIYGVRTKQIQRIQISIKISDDRTAH
ncbi:olfactory receptor 51E2 [Haliaeetus albicilla]|uniref:olfactory receptor 51E2-like n=1 Tax=Haliaeetus leucocephalus TaxID=52644 RepID=UPI00053CECAE|nr:PREDICTED: olfactory receptor 51E2-like [Haliaeetus leucocephalus]